MDATALKPAPPPLRDLTAAGPVALFLDFDGTLVEIAAQPEAISVPDNLATRLAALAERLEGRLALVSGRSIEDLERHCGPLFLACAGSHGAALRGGDGVGMGAAEALSTAVLSEVAEWAVQAGVRLEQKPHGVALHSRTCPELEESSALFLQSVADSHGLAVKRGKMVAELVRQGADKGAAVRRFMATAPFEGALPVFVGDDVTDEDGFAACKQLGGFGVTVGERHSQIARFWLSGPAAVIEWTEL